LVKAVARQLRGEGRLGMHLRIDSKQGHAGPLLLAIRPSTRHPSGVQNVDVKPPNA
jgi:hypothetical protein